MVDTELLGICTVDDAIGLYRKMILEHRARDSRLAEFSADEKSLRTLLMYSLDTDRNLFYLIRSQGRYVGFIDSALTDDGNGKWYIKSFWTEPEFRNSAVFKAVLARLEKGVRKRGITTLYSTAFLEDRAANELWAEAGYVLEPGRRVKVIR